MNIVTNFAQLFTWSQKKVQEKFKVISATLWSSKDHCIYPGAFLARAAQQFPDRIALICRKETITFGQLYKRASALSEQLVALGIKSDDRVCLLFENSIEYYIAYYGIWQTGAVVAPLNVFLTSRELEHILTDCKPALIIASQGLQTKIAPVNHANVPVLNQENFPPASHKEWQVPAVDPNRMAALLYTSGTTGMAKGVMLSSRNIVTNVAQVVATADVRPDDRLFAVLPLFHSFAQNTCVWSNIFIGVTTIIVPRIERHLILEGLAQRPTLMIGVPAFYGLLCLMKNAPLAHVRYFMSGGDALPDKIQASFQLIYRRTICNGYGLTEASPFIAAHLEDELVPINVIGKPGPGIQCLLVDEDGKEVAHDQIGILCVKGDNVMLGYYNALEATAAVLQDGCLNTGDFAQFDSKGRLAICGRYKDLIKNKGINIYPQEIENVLMSHSLVIRAAVVGKPDADGEIPIAFVAVREEKPGLEQELKKLCVESLAGYKVPKKFIIMKDLPLTATAKVNKRLLRAELEQK